MDDYSVMNMNQGLRIGSFVELYFIDSLPIGGAQVCRLCASFQSHVGQTLQSNTVIAAFASGIM
jgi:hypothetical protein